MQEQYHQPFHGGAKGYGLSEEKHLSWRDWLPRSMRKEEGKRPETPDVPNGMLEFQALCSEIRVV